MSAREAGFNLRESCPLIGKPYRTRTAMFWITESANEAAVEKPSTMLTEAGAFPLPAQRLPQVKLESEWERSRTLVTFGIPQRAGGVVRQTATYGVLQRPIMRTWEAASGMQRGVVLQGPKR